MLVVQASVCFRKVQTNPVFNRLLHKIMER